MDRYVYWSLSDWEPCIINWRMAWFPLLVFCHRRKISAMCLSRGKRRKILPMHTILRGLSPHEVTQRCWWKHHQNIRIYYPYVFQYFIDAGQPLFWAHHCTDHILSESLIVVHPGYCDRPNCNDSDPPRPAQLVSAWFDLLGGGRVVLVGCPDWGRVVWSMERGEKKEWLVSSREPPGGTTMSVYYHNDKKRVCGWFLSLIAPKGMHYFCDGQKIYKVRKGW